MSIYIAQGYEMNQELHIEMNGQRYTWVERRFLVQSTSGSGAAEHSLQNRLEEVEYTIQELLVGKQGKPHLKTRVEGENALQEILKIFSVEDLL